VAPEQPSRPLYARMLGLRHLNLSGGLCLLFGEGSVAFGVLLALAELTSWWAVAVVPVTVAGMVKINDLVAGSFARTASQATKPDRQSQQADRPGGQEPDRGGPDEADPAEDVEIDPPVVRPAVGRAAVVSSVEVLRPSVPRQRGDRTEDAEAGVRRSGSPSSG
jgi:hypothetical protein